MALCSPAVAQGYYDQPIYVSPLTVEVEENGQDLGGDYIARGQTFWVTAGTIYDQDSVGDPTPVLDDISSADWDYRVLPPWGDGEWYNLTGGTLEGSGVYRSEIELCFGADGDYEIKVTANDAAVYQDDDPESQTVEVQVRGVDYIVVLPNPAEVQIGGSVGLTGKAYNYGPDGYRYWDDYGNPIPGRQPDDLELAAAFQWDVDPELGTLNPTSGASTTFTAGQTAGTCTVSAEHEPSETSGSSQVEVLGVDYVIVLPNPAYVPVGGQVGLTGHAYNFGDDGERYYDQYGQPIQGRKADDIELSVTFDWTEYPEYRGTVNPTHGASTTFSAGLVPGSWTVTALHYPSGMSGSAAVYIFDISQSEDLWWFNGENAANYHEEVTLTAQGVTTGTFKWEVTAGADRVDLNNGGADADTITATDDNTVQVKSTGASAVPNDVSIRLTLNGSMICTHTLTVYAPASAVVVAGPNDSPYYNGYLSVYTMEVRDQFNAVVPDEIEVNEDLGAWVSDFPGENWPPVPPNGLMTDSSQFEDWYSIRGC